MPSGSTAAESVRNLIKKNPKYSKRINYDALKDLFVDGRQVVPSIDDKDDLYTMDDKSDGEGMMVLEEGGGGIGSQRSVTTTRLPREEQEEQGDEREDEESEKGDDHVVDIGWEDAYEQEV
jgi:transcription factor IIIB subunit 2